MGVVFYRRESIRKPGSFTFEVIFSIMSEHFENQLTCRKYRLRNISVQLEKISNEQI